MPAKMLGKFKESDILLAYVIQNAIALVFFVGSRMILPPNR